MIRYGQTSFEVVEYKSLTGFFVAYTVEKENRDAFGKKGLKM